MVGSMPSQEDARQGAPLSDGSGKWFDAMCHKAGVDKNALHIINTINCVHEFYPNRNTHDGHGAIDHCFNVHVLPLLNSHPWDRIDLLGEEALYLLAGRTSVTKWRGSPLVLPVLGHAKPVGLPTLHPSEIAKNQELMPVVVNDLRKTLVIPEEHYNLYPSLDDVKKFNHKKFAFDLETSYGKNPATGKYDIKIVGLCAKGTEAIVVPWAGAYIPELMRIFCNAEELIGQNSIQFDYPILESYGILFRPDVQHWDIMLMQHLRFPDMPHDLEFINSQLLSKPAWKDDKVILELYNARDVDVTYQCWLQLKDLLTSANLMDLYKNVQVPLAKICHLMHETGVKLDPDRIAEVQKKLTAQVKELELKIPEQIRTFEEPCKKRIPAPPGTISPKTRRALKFIHVDATKTIVPWRSTPKKIAYLYGKDEPWQLGLPVQTDVKTGKVSTGKMALAKLIRMAKDPAPIIALRELNKIDELISTFCQPDMLTRERQHTDFNVHGTSGGRLSSSGPNLQNIPPAARFLYVPTHADWQLVELDFSNIENRLTAYLAGDTKRLANYATPGYNDYKHFASVYFGIPYDEVVKDNDREAPYGKAKMVVLGSNYGLGALKLSRMHDLDFKEVKGLMAGWKKEIWETVKWQERTGEQAKKQGFLTNPFGRRRWFYTNSYYTESLSFLPQSTAADIIFRCMIAIMYERIGWPLEMVNRVVQVTWPLPEPIKLLLQVHDSLLFECPKDMTRMLIENVDRVMAQPWPELNGFAIPVGIAVGEPGESWGEMKPWKG